MLLAARVKYADVAEGDVARRHVEPPVVLRGKLLEALHTDIRTGLELTEDAPREQVLFIGGGFGHSGGVIEMRLEGRQEVAGWKADKKLPVPDDGSRKRCGDTPCSLNEDASAPMISGGV